MNSRIALVGLVLAGIALGWVTPDTASGGGQAYANHDCKFTSCAAVQADQGGTCGTCTSGQQSQFWKCLPEQNIVCSEDANLYGSTTCVGVCSDDAAICNYTLLHCK